MLILLEKACNLALASNICEAVPRSLFWALNRLNELPEVGFEFPLNLVGNLIIHYSFFNRTVMVHTQILVGPQNKVIGTGSQTDLTRGFIVSSVVQATMPVTLVGSAFPPPSMLVFASWHVRRKKSTLGGQEHNFLSEYWYSMGCPNLM